MGDAMADRATVDFDHHNREFHEDRHARWAELRQCPVAYNANYGGFWVVSGYDEVAIVSRDAETFTSRYLAEPDDGIDYLGIAGLPRGRIPPQGIAEVEGPRHGALRRVLNRFLAPPAIARLQPLMEVTTTWFLDQRIETGSIDLVFDLANPVPAILTMELVGLPHDSWPHYAAVFHGTVSYRPGSPEHHQAIANVPGMVAELQHEIDARRRQPRDDLLTQLVEMEVDGELDGGRRLTDEELVSVLWNLVAGGLDTTTSLTSLTLFHLDEHHDLRRRLVDEPHLLGAATDEFLRYFSVNETLTRTVTRDVELGGQQLCRGDHLMLSWLSANRDERAFERPDEVDLDRERNPHLAFGVGRHRCIGMHMARTMFQVLVRQVLDRMPDYEIDRDATRFYQGNPQLNGAVRMPATFTPGPVVGPSERPF
ncbi:MAG TPA: cytochrome P450 [Acidimicrobiales bacterium]|nr:cytochrome P450 [Acidimicrobiales bacterium]